MRLWVAGASLALLFFVVLAASAPAHLAGRLLPADKIRLSGFSGTIWDGEASSASIATEGGWVQLGRLQWELSQLYLLMLSPTADITSSWGRQRVSANVRLYPSGDVLVRGLDTSFSAIVVKRWLPVNLRGDISVTMPSLSISEGVAETGSGRMVWQRAAWRGTRGSRPLGDYVMQFDITAPQQLRGEVSTLAGPILVEGGFTLDGRDYTLDARVTSDEVFDPELASALSLLATPTDGGFRLKFESSF